MRDDRPRWNQRYAAARDDLPQQAASLLVRHRSLLENTAGRQAIDLACGPGRNALFLAKLGFSVDAMDISEVALHQLAKATQSERLRIRPVAIDLDRVTLPHQRYDVVTLFNYLNRSLFAQIEDALTAGGLLFIETFTEEDRQTAGLSMRRDYLLRKDELQTLFSGLRVIDCWEGVRGDNKGRKRGKASLVAKKP